MPIQGEHVSKSNGLDQSPIHLMHRANQTVTDLFLKAIKSDLTPRQLAVLTVIAQQEGCSQTDIVEATGIDRSTVAEMIGRLVKKGSIERRRSRQDTRRYVLRLTQEGHRILRNTEPLAKRVDEKILRALGNRGSAFLDNLTTLAVRLGGSRKA